MFYLVNNVWMDLLHNEGGMSILLRAFLCGRRRERHKFQGRDRGTCCYGKLDQASIQSRCGTRADNSAGPLA